MNQNEIEALFKDNKNNDVPTGVVEDDAAGKQEAEVTEEGGDAQDEAAEPKEIAPESVADPESQPPGESGPSTPRTVPGWIKAMVVINSILAITGIVMAYGVLTNLNSHRDSASALFQDLTQQCAHTRSTVSWMRGGPLDNEHPLWNEIYQPIDLDREVLIQVPTRCGVVNVERPRPESLNNRAELEFRITNPTTVHMCRGKLIVRSSPTAHNSWMDHDYEGFRAFQRSLNQQSFEIPDLAPGAFHEITVSVRQDDESDPEHCDFRITFDYFKPTT